MVPPSPKRLLWLGLCAGSFLLGFELTSRFDDWLAWKTPLLASPDWERDLALHDEAGRRTHGKPGGSFRKFHLNAFGFRGPEMEEVPRAGCPRVLLLGSSETFGMFESENQEYPAQLSRELNRDGCIEVVNAAMHGMKAGTMISYWRDWASRFRPKLVLIYPNAIFYLHDETAARAPSRAVASPAPSPAPPIFESRMLLRVRDLFHALPRGVRRWKWDRDTAKQRNRHDAAWLFSDVPADRLETYLKDVQSLVASVKASGARPVLIVPAIKPAFPVESEDRNELAFIVSENPQATEEIVVKFHERASAGLRRLAQSESLKTIDLASELDGKRELFVDVNHFTDAGAGVVAHRLATELRSFLAGGR